MCELLFSARLFFTQSECVFHLLWGVHPHDDDYNDHGYLYLVEWREVGKRQLYKSSSFENSVLGGKRASPFSYLLLMQSPCSLCFWLSVVASPFLLMQGTVVPVPLGPKKSYNGCCQQMSICFICYCLLCIALWWIAPQVFFPTKSLQDYEGQRVTKLVCLAWANLTQVELTTSSTSFIAFFLWHFMNAVYMAPFVTDHILSLVQKKSWAKGSLNE